MDVDKLNKEIISTLDTDEAVQSYLADITNAQYARWSKDTLGFIWIDERIYIPLSGDLRLCVLHSYHDHPVSGHFGINKTLALIRQEYTWPSICTFVTDYCRSCTTCSQNKAKRHKPYSLLHQLPVPSCPWNSISTDFIEHLPVSEGFTTILVVVDISPSKAFSSPHTTPSLPLSRPNSLLSMYFPSMVFRLMSLLIVALSLSPTSLDLSEKC